MLSPLRPRLTKTDQATEPGQGRSDWIQNCEHIFATWVILGESRRSPATTSTSYHLFPSPFQCVGNHSLEVQRLSLCGKLNSSDLKVTACPGPRGPRHHPAEFSTRFHAFEWHCGSLHSPLVLLHPGASELPQLANQN